MRLKLVRAALALTVVFAPVSIAFAHERFYVAVLSGAAESPPNGSEGAGSVFITADLDLGTLEFDVSFTGLSGPATGAHLHGMTAVAGVGVAGIAMTDPMLPDFPVGVTEGEYEGVLDLALASSYSADFITRSGGTIADALNAVIFGMEDGTFYFEIDTAAFPNGEIRGFLSRVRVFGDMDCDGEVTNFDIDPFVMALVNHELYETTYPDCDHLNGDVNRDNELNNFDIDGFVACILAGGCQ